MQPLEETGPGLSVSRRAQPVSLFGNSLEIDKHYLKQPFGVPWMIIGQRHSARSCAEKDTDNLKKFDVPEGAPTCYCRDQFP
jgi:hypothetical protein